MQEILSALNLKESFVVTNQANLSSCFAVSELAASSVGAIGSAITSLVEDLGLVSSAPSVQVDQRLASLWFTQSIHPLTWKLPPIWDSIAGDYQTNDGWIKLHTNLPHHRQAALSVLESKAERADVAAAIADWGANDLETAIVDAGGVAAMMRSRAAWRELPQGIAVACEPLVTWVNSRFGNLTEWQPTRRKPLNGLRVLDLTRVLAGPVSSRTLAGFGANILRVDPPGWDEPFVVPDITLGKRCANLQLHRPTDRKIFESLLTDADLLVHGYRPGALDKLGYGAAERRQLSPNLIEVSLDAYGWVGPWSKRRGFDSLVQMSCGIADAGMHWANQVKPTPLPVQALDHATGYLMAAAAIQAIRNALSEQRICDARLSLARTAELLMKNPQNTSEKFDAELLPKDFVDKIESTPWGDANRLKPPLIIDGTPMQWDLAACNLGSSKPTWA